MILLQCNMKTLSDFLLFKLKPLSSKKPPQKTQKNTWQSQCTQTEMKDLL